MFCFNFKSFLMYIYFCFELTCTQGICTGPECQTFINIFSFVKLFGVLIAKSRLKCATNTTFLYMYITRQVLSQKWLQIVKYIFWEAAMTVSIFSFC